MGGKLLTLLKFEVLCSSFIFSYERRIVCTKAVRNWALELGSVGCCSGLSISVAYTPPCIGGELKTMGEQIGIAVRDQKC